MSFSNVKEFLKDEWTVLATLLLGGGQVFMFIELIFYVAKLIIRHANIINNHFLDFLTITWLILLLLSIVFPAATLSNQSYKIKRLKTENKLLKQNNNRLLIKTDSSHGQTN